MEAPLDDSVEHGLGLATALVDEESRAGEPISFEQLYETYFEFVWRSLRLFGVRQPYLDDAVQDVFGVVARQLSGFEGRSSVRTWLYGIAQYTAANHLRHQRRKAAPLEPMHDGLASAEPSPQAQAEAKELAELVLSFCDSLDAGRRAVFVLCVLEGVPAIEVAELLQIPVNTVYSRARALRLALKERLARGSRSQ